MIGHKNVKFFLMIQGHGAVDYKLQYLSNNYVTLGKFFSLPEPQNLKFGVVLVFDLVTQTF